MIERCQCCFTDLPPLDGTEENDFAYLCETCDAEEKGLMESYYEI